MIKLNVHPYPNRVWFTIDRDKFMEKRKSACGMTDEFYSEGCVSSDDSMRNQVIGVFNVSHETIAHEVGHVVHNLFIYVGMPANDSTQEAFCYLTGSIHKQIYAYLKKIGVDVNG